MTIRSSFTKKERVAAFILSLAVFLLGWFDLDNNCDWGDDYAAYMTDGIAIAEGRYDEQILLNSILRYGISDGPKEHIHSFGLPLLHALVYRLFGFDRVGFDNLYMYKVPTLIAFSVAAGIFYLLLLSRTDALLSLLGCIMLFSNGVLFYYIRNLGNDVLFMSLTLMCFFCAERFLYGESGRVKKGVLLGILVWFTYSVRLNGISVVLAVLLAHALALIREKKKPELKDALPYAVFAILFVAVNVLIFPKPTSTSTLTGDFALQKLAEGIVYYSGQLLEWVNSVTSAAVISPLRFVLHLIFPQKDPVTFYKYFAAALNGMVMLFVVIGLITDSGIRNVHLTVFTLLTFLVTSSLCLMQELRYLLVILPYFVMYFCSGVQAVFSPVFKKRTKLLTSVRTAFVCLACILLLVPKVRADIENIREPNRELLTAYSDYAVETYNYISTNLDGNATVMFFKPRALYLNTGRISIPQDKTDIEAVMPEHYLYYKPSHDFLLSGELEESYEKLFENYEFELYRKIASVGD